MNTKEQIKQLEERIIQLEKEVKKINEWTTEEDDKMIGKLKYNFSIRTISIIHGRTEK